MTGLIIPVLFAVVNLFCNPDYSEDDGLGRDNCWTLYHNGVQSVSARALTDGEWELTAREPKNGYFRQAPVTLVPGARYRLSAEVKCDLPPGAAFSLDIENHWFGKNIRVPVPQSTKGAWQKISWEGAMIDSRDVKDYSIGWVARAGQGGSASIRIRTICLEPLDTAAIEGSRPLDARERVKIPARIVPIDPLLTRVNPEAAVFTCYWPGIPAGGVSNCMLKGTILGRNISTQLDANGRGRLDFGQLGGEEARLDLEVVDLKGKGLRKDSYRVKFTKPKDLKGPEGRRLNNLVVEIANGDLRNGKTSFFRQGDGFVWISFTAADGGVEHTARGYLDGSAEAIVKFDPDERYTESMRFVKAGWHVLTITGAQAGSRMRIHAVPWLGVSLWGVRLPDGGPCSFDEDCHIFTTPFMRRYRLPAANMASACGHRFDDPANPTARFLAARGMLLFGVADYRSTWVVDRDVARRAFRDGMWMRGWGVMVDEMCIHEPRSHHAAVADTLWDMYNECPERQVHIYLADANRYAFDDEKVHASELAALANTGGFMMPELYATATKEIVGVDAAVNHYAEVKRSAERFVPAMKGKFYLHMSPYTGLGHWTSATYPEVDLKHQYAYLMYRLVTDPRFADAGGLGGGPTAYCEEELIRWTGRCFRYYGIEGGRENLAEQFGYVRLPGLIDNADFDRGLEGWTIESGDVAPQNYRGLGKLFEARVRAREGEGDNVAVFTTKTGVPARISQVLKGVRDGEYYTVMFALGNADALEHPVTTKPPRAFAVRMDGGVCIKDLTIHYRIRRSQHILNAPKDSVGYLNTYRYVFRATGTEARLIFEDRDDMGISAPEGTRQFINYIVVRPFYHEDDDDIAELIKVIKGRPPHTVSHDMN